MKRAAAVAMVFLAVLGLVGATAGEKRSQRRSTTPAAGTVVRLLPSREIVSVGEPLAIAVDLSAGVDVGHVPFHLRFDPSVLRFDRGEEGDFLGGDGKPTVFVASPKTSGNAVVVGLSRLGQVGGIDGDGRLCILHFTAVGSGNAGLGFARARVRNADNRSVQAVFEGVDVEVR